MCEHDLVEVLCSWLQDRGWKTEQNVNHIDIVATRGAEELRIEAKGSTAAPGTDVDTLYGQIHRRLLRIEMFELTEQGAVIVVDG